MGLFGDVLGGIGSFVGSVAGQGDRDQAAQYLQNATQQFQGLNPGIMPELEGTVTQGDSQLLSADPTTRSAQLSALNQLQSQYKQGGLDAITRSQLNDINNSTAQQARTAQSAVAQDAARRGLANSGSSLVAQQLAAQQAAQTGANQGMQAAALAQQNRTNALNGAANLATGVRGQDYQAASAQDAINRFNAQNAQSVQNNNINRNMQAQQQTYQNTYNKDQGIAGGYDAQAGQSNTQAGATQKMWTGLGQGIGAAGDAAMTAATGMPSGGDSSYGGGAFADEAD